MAAPNGTDAGDAPQPESGEQQQQQQQEQGQQQGQQQSKRRRIGYACDICRAKKNRCDGERPTCGPCLARRLQCVYSAQKSRASVTQEYVDNLKARNLLLERQLAAQNPNGQNYFPSPYTGDAELSPPATVSTEASRQSLRNGTPVQPTSSQRYAQFGSPSQSMMGMNSSMPYPHRNVSSENLRGDQRYVETPMAAPRQTVEPESRRTNPREETPRHIAAVDPQDKSYFGESSTFDFMTKLGSPEGEISKGPVAAARRQGPASVAASLAMSSPSAPIFEGMILGPGTDDPFGLPHRFVADRLVDAYFKFRHPLNSYLHEQTFRKRYACLWQSEELGGEEATENNLAWFGLVNLIFAFGSDHAQVAGRTSVDRARFFKRAKTLVFSGLLQAGSIELVQALLLMGQYLHGSLELNNCWTVVGLAIRMAQGLGLHLEASNFTSDIIEQEIRKRVWWGCFVMDRILSMKVGRPPTIHDGPGIKVGMPLAVDDEYLSAPEGETPVQPPGIPSKLDFLNQVIPQCRLLERICETLYSEGHVDDSKQRATDLPKLLALSIQLDGDLVAWQQTLPAHLRADSQVQGWHFERQRNTLLMRFLNSRLLLHRQILLIFVTRRITDGFQREIMYCYVRRCIMAAHDTITQMRLLHQRRLLHSWWHNSHYVFASLGVVLAFQTLDPQSKEEVALPPSIDVDQVILQGRALLEEVGGHLHPLATRYLQSLQKLEGRLRNLSASKARGNGGVGPSDPKLMPMDTPAPDVQGGGLPQDDNSNSNAFPGPEGIDAFGNWNAGEAMMFDEDFLEIENMFYSTGWVGVMDDFEA